MRHESSFFPAHPCAGCDKRSCVYDPKDVCSDCRRERDAPREVPAPPPTKVRPTKRRVEEKWWLMLTGRAKTPKAKKHYRD